MAPVDRGGGPGAGSDAPGTRPARILVVDDEPGMRLVLARALARLGYQVFATASGPEALDQLRVLDDIDAVVSDVTMPGMTGIEMVQELLWRHPGIPVLFVTASPIPWDLLLNPLIGLLPKPPRIVDLHERLEALMAGGIARAAAAADPFEPDGSPSTSDAVDSVAVDSDAVQSDGAA